jgi:hypothetical protein
MSKVMQAGFIYTFIHTFKVLYIHIYIHLLIPYSQINKMCQNVLSNNNARIDVLVI